MQGISDESFIKTQGKGKQLNKLIPHPYTNNYLGKCNLCMDRTSDRSRLSCNHCIVKCLSDFCPMYLDHKPFLLNQTYMAVYCLMNAYSFTVSSTN